jgi:hypothetical protein
LLLLTSATETMTNQAIEENEWTGDASARTYDQDETRDHLPGASLMMTEFPSSSTESRPSREPRKARCRGKGNRLQFLKCSGWAGREMPKSCLSPSAEGKATGKPDALNGACPVLRRAERKGLAMAPRSRPFLLY